MDKNYNYRWTKGFGIAILIFIILLAGAAFGQSVSSGSVNTPSGFSIDLTTGNLIGYDSSLKTNNGWTSTSGSSGGWVPYGSPQGSFNATDGYTFSYVGEELGVAGVSLSSFPHGYQNTSAVFVTGFMYGLKYRFPCANQIGGNCTDTNGLQDTLRVEVGYYPATGPATFYLHQLGLKNQTDGNPPYNMTWQTLAETVTFAGAKPLSQAGSVNMGIYGMDAGFWACIMPTCYGPQVKDAYIRANYSVDPCILNPAYNPSCPGFNQVLQGPLSPLIWNNYNIATALPHIGGGVQLHGFDYGFGYYAGDYCTAQFIICWSSSGANGRNVSLNITDKFGNSLFTDSWWVEGNYSGGSRSGSMLFTETKNTLNMGNVTWNAYGGYGDNMGLSFYTRPIWTPDPCYDQPLYSKNCSNFDAEIKRLAAEQKTIQEKSLASTVANISTTSPTPQGSVTNTVNDANTSNPTVTTTTTTNIETNTTTSPKASSSSTTAAVATATDETTKATKVDIRESQTAGSSSTTRVEVNRDHSSTSFALSLINRNQDRETNIAMQASQNAIKEGEQRGMQSMRQAERIVMDQQQKMIQNNGMIPEQNMATGTEFKPQNQNNGMAMLITPPQSTSVVQVQVLPNFANPQISQQANNQASQHVDTVVNFNNNVFTISAPVVQTQIASIAPVTSVPIITQTQSTSVVSVSPLNIQQQSIQQNSVVVRDETITKYEIKETTSTQTNFVTDRTNPITELVDSSKPIQQVINTQTNTSNVKSNVQDNDAAAGISIDTIARTPIGFNSYMVALTDASFYTPKEIYRNQKTIDNVRALRQLASDRLHQQMVDQQYLPR
jgi:hypothetical protein